MRHRSSPLVSRLATLLVCVALAFGQGAELAHTLLARHVYCALHGAWEHVVADEASEPVAAACETEGTRVVPEGSSEEHHERCSFEACPHEKTVALLPFPGSAVGRAPAARATCSATAARPLPQVPLILLAPSHSPPA